MPATFEIESAQRAQQLMRELVTAEGTYKKLRIMADLLGETGYIPDTPVAKRRWSGEDERRDDIDHETWDRRPR